MSSSALRGAVLVAVAVLLGFLILRGSEDLGLTPVGATTTAQATATPEIDPTDSESAPIAAPTAITTPARPNSEVSVLVANGTDISGQASRLTDRLRNQGFNTRQPQNSNPQATSVIYYRPGFAAEAMVVRTVVNVPTPIAPMPVPDPNIGAGIDLVPVDVLVLVGADDLSTG